MDALATPQTDGQQGQQQKDQKIVLAKRPRLEYDQQSKPIQLSTNYLKLDLLKEIEEFYLLRVDFTPLIEVDNKVLREKLLNSCKSQLRDCLGNHYLINAAQIFSVEKPSFTKETTIKTTFQKAEYQVHLKITKVLRTEDLNSDNQKKSQEPLLFFNVLVKNMLKNLNFFEFGQFTKFFEPSAEYHKKIEGTNLIAYKGWNTPFENCKDGLMMKMDLTNKFARNENALNFINLIYKSNPGLDKEEKRKLVQQKLQNLTVMTNYGNFISFKIYDIVFDKNCKETKISDIINDPNQREQQMPIEQPAVIPQLTSNDADLTLYEYYLKKYGLKIKFDKQPLLLAYQKRHKKYIYLVPELCVLTGVPDELNDFQQQELVKALQIKPQDLYEMITQFIGRLINPNSTESNLGATQISESLDISFDQKPNVIKAKQIAYPTITFGSVKKEAPRQTLEDNTATYFQMKYPIYNSSNFLSIAILYFKDFNTSDLFSNWIKVQKELRIEVKKPVEYNLGEINNKAMQEIEHVIRREIKKEKFDIVAIIAPTKFATTQNYNKIKKLCTIQQQIKSQYIRQSSLENSKSPYAVSSAILSQMAAKCGATLWVANPPNGVPDNTMIIGTSVQKAFVNGVSQFVVGFVASQDKYVSRFYSRATFQSSDKDNIEKISTFIVDAIKQYFIQNKSVPENIIYLRENISDNSIVKYLSTEIKEVLKSFTVLSPQYKPKLCVILLESHHGVRCFHQTGENKNEFSNPPSGTIIDNHITSKMYYDFYMISQNVKSGTATPVHYKIIYDTTGFPEGRLQELLYSQCFNYVNWSGAIKYPAQIQYAKKLAKMVGTHIQEEVSEKLFNSRFYI